MHNLHISYDNSFAYILQCRIRTGVYTEVELTDEVVPMLVVELCGNADDPPEEVRGEAEVARGRLTLDIVLPQAVRSGTFRCLMGPLFTGFTFGDRLKLEQSF